MHMTISVHGRINIVHIKLMVRTHRIFTRTPLLPLYRYVSGGILLAYGLHLTRRVSLVEQELLTLAEHLSSHPVFCGVRVTRSLV
jgi:hypothetical protein